MLYRYTRSPPSTPLLSPSPSLAWVPPHCGHLHTQGRAHTLQMPLPSPFGSDSHPSAPLLPIRLAFSPLSSLSLFLGAFCIFIRPQIFFSPSKARHRAVQTPTQERNSRPKSAHHKKKSSCKGERGGEGNSARQSSCRLPPPFCSIEFSAAHFFLSILTLLGTKRPVRLLRQAEPSSPVLRTCCPFLRLSSAVLRPGYPSIDGFCGPFRFLSSLSSILCDRRNNSGRVAPAWHQ
ncbi:hypothetical protein CI102_8251 [Trichoderma harzianum]|uniref:Uncharacterized protein n=1 Tax=Trichoderma harzianum CBS 226.95 TaxID=983964 RepID=A0A2T4APH0_TRIHA|nr:hypothetical protein M431DRAFT_544171 [Trichoderma harzianum CBS 226.95]PKK51520.1 hypothetical protein CI102_8251 [Trichoderma harzianum]PTB58975.1 hypothetical protein M431DRAFT_544171 [Trichoderma harzianum CBS 226.95]